MGEVAEAQGDTAQVFQRPLMASVGPLLVLGQPKNATMDRPEFSGGRVVPGRLVPARWVERRTGSRTRPVAAVVQAARFVPVDPLYGGKLQGIQPLHGAGGFQMSSFL